MRGVRRGEGKGAFVVVVVFFGLFCCLYRVCFVLKGPVFGVVVFRVVGSSFDKSERK